METAHLRPVISVLQATLAAMLLAGCNRPGLLPHVPDSPQVKVSIVRSGQLPNLLEITGEVTSTRKAVVNAQQSGLVERVNCHIGERVSAGQELLWLRPGKSRVDVSQQEANVSAAQAQVEQARIQVEFARKQNISDIAHAVQALRQAEIAISQAQTQLSSDLSDRDRKKDLLAQKAVAKFDYEQAALKVKITQDQLADAKSKADSARTSLLLARQGEAQIRIHLTDVDKAVANLRQAESALEAARIDLATTIITSPISGVVVDRQVEPGQSVGPGGPPLLTLLNNDAAEIIAVVDSRFAERLRPGLLAKVTTALDPNKHYQARLQGVIPSGDAKNNTFRVAFKPDSLPRELKNGTSVRLSLNLQNHSGILVPLAAVRGQPDQGEWVWAVRQEKVTKIPLKIQFRDDSTALVTEGLRDSEAVVVTGSDDLSEGQTIRVLQVREPYNPR